RARPGVDPCLVRASPHTPASDGRKEPAVPVADGCNREGLQRNFSWPAPPGPIAIPECADRADLTRGAGRDADRAQPDHSGFAPYVALLHWDRCDRSEPLRCSCARLPAQPETGISLR